MSEHTPTTVLGNLIRDEAARVRNDATRATLRHLANRVDQQEAQVRADEREQALQRLAGALFRVDSTHHVGFGDDGLTCLCGFVGSARKRTQTEHITAAVLEAFNHD